MHMQGQLKCAKQQMCLTQRFEDDANVKLPYLARLIICGWATSAHFGVELQWNRTLNVIETYRKDEDWVYGQPVLKYPRDWRAFRLRVPAFFRIISLSALKPLRYRAAPAFWALRWALEYSYNYITINIKVWGPARHVKGISSTDLSVKIQPHRFGNGIAFALGHINWFWYLEKVEGVYLMPVQLYFTQFWEVEGNLWVKGFLSFVWKRKHCPNHVFNTIPCLQFDPLLRHVKKIDNLALYRYSLYAESLRYIISSCVLMLFHVEGSKFAVFEMYLEKEQY